MVLKRNTVMKINSSINSGGGSGGGSGGASCSKNKWPTSRHEMGTRLALLLQQERRTKAIQKTMLFLVAAYIGWLLVPSSTPLASPLLNGVATNAASMAQTTTAVRKTNREATQKSTGTTKKSKEIKKSTETAAKKSAETTKKSAEAMKKASGEAAEAMKQSAEVAKKKAETTKTPPEAAKTIPEAAKTSPETTKRIPTVLLAGTQKASTSALAVYLMNLAGTCFSDADLGEEGGHGKEPHFFDEKYSGGLDFYRHLFRKCASTDLLIDGTPETMMHPDKVRLIYEQQGTTKDVRIIFILREPVAREISWYNHKLRYAVLPNKPNWTDTMFDKDGHMRSFIRVHRRTVTFNFEMKEYDQIYGYYSYWLKEWAKHFDRSTQILVLSYDELVKEPKAMLKRVHDFLDLPISIPLELTRENTNSKRTPDPPCVYQREVGEYFKVPNVELYDYLEKHPGPSMEERPFRKFHMKCPPQPQIPMVLFAGADWTGITTVADYFRYRHITCFADPPGYNGMAQTMHFFTESQRYERGLSVYQEKFAKCDYTHTVMDGSPGILVHPQRVKDTYDQHGGMADVVKIVLVLREPVTSHILSYQSMGQDPLLKKAGGIQAVMKQQRDGTVSSEHVVAADYVFWLKQWCKLFDRKQILLLSHEELIRDPEMIVKRVANFMEQDVFGSFPPYSEAMNQTRMLPPCDDAMQSELKKAFQEPNKELYAFLDAHPGSEHEQSPYPRFEFACQK